MTSRMAERIKRDCVELGSEGRLIRLQLEELVGDVPDGARRDRPRLPRRSAPATRRRSTLEELARAAATRSCSSSSRLAELLGYPRGVEPARPRRSRRAATASSRTSRGCPSRSSGASSRDLGRLDAVVRASQRELEAVEGVGAVRAREIREGLRRLQEHNLVDRYLQL